MPLILCQVLSFVDVLGVSKIGIFAVVGEVFCMSLGISCEAIGPAQRIKSSASIIKTTTGVMSSEPLCVAIVHQ
jgi:hypothetical protein